MGAAVNALARGRARRSRGGSGTWARDPVVGIGQRWPHTFARAAARAPRIAAIAAAGSSPRASISRLIVGVGGHRAEQRRLGTHQRGVCQAVIAQRNCDRQIQHRLARVVHRPRQPPRTQRPRQRASQTTDRSGLQQHRRPARRDQRLAARFDTNTTTTTVTLHLRSAFQLAGSGPLTSPISPALPCITRRTQPRSHERSRLTHFLVSHPSVLVGAFDPDSPCLRLRRTGQTPVRRSP